MQPPREDDTQGNRSGPEENTDALLSDNTMSPEQAVHMGPNEVSYILHFFIYC